MYVLYAFNLQKWPKSAKTGVHLGVYKLVVEATNQYTRATCQTDSSLLTCTAEQSLHPPPYSSEDGGIGKRRSNTGAKPS